MALFVYVGFITCMLPAILLCAEATSVDSSGKSIHADTSQYSKWPGKRVPFYIDQSLAPMADQIRASAKKVSDDLSGCVTFEEVPATSSEYKVRVTNKKADGVTTDARCSSYPGIWVANKNAGAKEQRVVITSGPTGCLDGTKHSIMKFFAIVLGKLNEHQRGDRDEYIKINQANLLPDTDNVYGTHSETSQINSFPYDYCSITHNQQDEYAKKGTEAFIVKKAPLYIPKLNRLSETDCRELSNMYGCDPTRCEPLNCADLDDSEGANNGGDETVTE